jgi:hypothetical protein
LSPSWASIALSGPGADLLPQILQRRLAVAVVQRPMATLAVAPVETDCDPSPSAEPGYLAKELGSGHYFNI